MPMLDDLGAYLVANGGGVVIGTDLFLGRMPETPAECLALIEYEGGMLPRQDDSDGLVEDARVQLLVRSATYATARTRARSSWAILGAIVNATIGTTFYARVQPLQAPFPIARDDNDRIIFAANFAVMRESA